MRITKLAMSAGAALALAQTPAAADRPLSKVGDVSYMTVDFQADFSASFPGRDASGVGGLLLNDRDAHTLHRVLLDKERRLYYGYDVGVEKTDSGYQVTIGPLGAEAERYFRDNQWPGICPDCPAPHRVQAAQRFPSPRVIRPGDTINVDLLEDARGGVVTDAIIIQSGPDTTPPQERPVHVFPPVDFEPKTVLLQMATAELLANGAPAWPGGSGGGSVQGQVIYVDLPQHGRVSFSLVATPHCPWQRGGVVSGRTIAFTVDGIKYEWTSTGPVATAGPILPFNNVQSWNLWMIHDKDYRPFTDGYSMGAGAEGVCPSTAKVSSR